MGKKGKKAKSGGKVKGQQHQQHAVLPTHEINNNNSDSLVDGDELAFIQKDKRGQFCKPTTNGPLLLPKKTNMTLDAQAMQQKLLSIPTKKRTPTAERLIQAEKMMDNIGKLQLDRKDYYNNERFVDIGTLKADESYVKECTLWIQAFVSSDFHVGCTKSVLIGSPMPECSIHITSLRPLDINEPQLMNVDALSFVVLLATAIRMIHPQIRLSLQIVYELHAHALYMDFDELQQHEEAKEIDESYLRFALAWVGIKCARRMYRESDERISTPFQNKNDVAIQSNTLLKSIETFANEQCQYKPDSPVGYWNLGWVCSQVKHNGKHPWKAANECYNLLADCCLLAEKADDDYYRAVAGIDMAHSLIIGGKPIVGYSLPDGEKVQVLRDLNVNDTDGNHDFKTPIQASNLAAAKEAGDKETKRLSDRVCTTLLEPGESILVPHWEVSKIWNFAMTAYKRLDAIGQGLHVYGETLGWDQAEGFLTSKLVAPGRYMPCPQVGFLSIRQKGSFPCGYCGKVEDEMKQCSICKKAQCK